MPYPDRKLRLNAFIPATGRHVAACPCCPACSAVSICPAIRWTARCRTATAARAGRPCWSSWPAAKT